MRRRLLADFIGDGAQRQFAQGREVRLPEEIRERLLDLLGLVDLALPQARPKFLDGDIDVDDLVGPIEERIRHGLTHAHARDSADGVVERFEMLDVHRRHHANAGVEDLEHVLIALLVAAARSVRVRELVDHAERRLSRQDRIDVHLLEGDPAIVDLPAWNDLQVADLRFGLRAPVRLDVPNDDVDAVTPKCVRVLDHRVGLADARCGADVDAETGSLIRLDLGEHLFASRSASILHGFILARRISSQAALYELFMVFWRTV